MNPVRLDQFNLIKEILSAERRAGFWFSPRAMDFPIKKIPVCNGSGTTTAHQIKT
jgi:hypothetical protein